MPEITTAQYRDLVIQALPDAADSDTDPVQRETLFTPNSHRRALEPDVTVVKGARGVGKTYWFKSLREPELRELAAAEYRLPHLKQVETLAGFGSRQETDSYPDSRILAKLVEDGVDPVDIWTTVVLKALDIEEFRANPDWEWSERIRWLRDQPEKAARARERADNLSKAEKKTKLILFDALDRLNSERAKSDRLASGILQVALELRLSTSNIRAKVFIRHDMLESAPTFPDASKLTSNAADLTWSVTDLYGLLFQYLGNTDTPESALFRAHSGRWTGNEERQVPPEGLIGDRDVQTKYVTELASAYMGTDHRKGYTYPWLPNHLADGNGQTSPRSFLVALRAAGEETQRTFVGHGHPLHWDAIRRGVQKASQIRVEQVSEDMPWVKTAIEPLKGMQVPMEEADLVARWRSNDLETLLEAHNDSLDRTRTGPRNARNYPKLIDELITLGIMTRRANGKIDLPDVYRLAFGLGRKGGVPRPKS
ncbi:hypothetical protein [Amycolatopsis solani]|uniref:hypothetical protein n=1 Tax=Amycolatopsis solani TaxID=3028615 RepID=UPI0025B03E1B|nr:hypothetical protein [Amycolatopsis sp. MEP2-6]